MKIPISSDKIILSAVEKNDAKHLLELRTSPEVNKFLRRDTNKNLPEIESFINELRAGDSHFFTIKTPDSAFAGTICLWNINLEDKYAEVGYELLPHFQGRGIMSAAMKAVLSFAFEELQFDCIGAYTHRENLRSRKLLEKFDFTLNENKTDPEDPDNVIYEKRLTPTLPGLRRQSA